MKILLVRLRLIGDVVFTTPLIRAIRQHYPHAHLTYLVEAPALPVVAGNPHLDDVRVVPRRSGLARLKDDLLAARSLRRERFDLAIDLHGGPRGALLTWLSGAVRRIGYETPGRSWMYTQTVPRPADLGPRHSVSKQWDLLAPLGIGDPDPRAFPYEMPDDAGAAARVEERLRAAKISHDHALVVIHVSAGNPFRRWPESSFAEVVAELALRDPARRVILTSGPSDAAAAARVAASARARLGSAAGAVPDVGEFDLAQLRALVQRAAVYIGGDSGPLHVAGTTRTPIVALLGPTLPVRSMPWRAPELPAESVDAGPLPCRPCNQRQCVHGDFRCLTGITPGQVIEAAERMMKGRA